MQDIGIRKLFVSRGLTCKSDQHTLASVPMPDRSCLNGGMDFLLPFLRQFRPSNPKDFKGKRFPAWAVHSRFEIDMTGLAIFVGDEIDMAQTRRRLG